MALSIEVRGRAVDKPVQYPCASIRSQLMSWVREEMGGNWYRADRPPSEGWLCPALFHYFDDSPEEIYVKAEPKKIV